MNRFFPYDQRFNAENFGWQPTWLILQALSIGAKFQREQSHLDELGIATLTAVLVNCNRDPKKSEPAKPSDFWYFTPQDEQEPRLDAVAADAFFSLVQSERMPSWCVAIAPVDRLREVRANGPVPKCRAWVKKGVLLITPRIEDGVVKVPLAIVDGVAGSTSVIDVDSGATRQVIIPNDKGEAFWVADAEFQLVE